METTVNGLPVYLDNWAIIDLAKGSTERRDRFIKSLHAGADLMFSITNAVELAGPQFESSKSPIRTFLDGVGAHWFPMTIGTQRILEVEAQGRGSMSNCVSSELLRAFFEDRTAGIGPGSGRLILPGEDFFGLSPLIDWLAPRRDELRAMSQALDDTLIPKIAEARAVCDADPGLLDRAFPIVTFDQTRPTTFVQSNLVRGLVAEAKAFKLKKGDGCDFFHVVMGVTFSTFAAIDKHWKRRVLDLPTPSAIARVYAGPELDQLVADLEEAVTVLSEKSRPFGRNAQ